MDRISRLTDGHDEKNYQIQIQMQFKIDVYIPARQNINFISSPSKQVYSMEIRQEKNHRYKLYNHMTNQAHNFGHNMRYEIYINIFI